jgi:hypothetical protein
MRGLVKQGRGEQWTIVGQAAPYFRAALAVTGRRQREPSRRHESSAETFIEA